MLVRSRVCKTFSLTSSDPRIFFLTSIETSLSIKYLYNEITLGLKPEYVIFSGISFCINYVEYGERYSLFSEMAICVNNSCSSQVLLCPVFFWRIQSFMPHHSLDLAILSFRLSDDSRASHIKSLHNSETSFEVIRSINQSLE